MLSQRATSALALSINTYNAFVVKGILDQYSRVNDVGRYRYFIGRGYSVGDKTINLYDLERKVVVDGKNSDGGFVRLGDGGAGCASASSKGPSRFCSIRLLSSMHARS